MTAERVRDRLLAGRVIPVLRLASAAQTRLAVECLHEVGFRAFEITMTTPGAVELVGELAASFSDSLVGAGTVLDLDEARRCIAANAHFLVSPCFVPRLPELAHAGGCAAILGGYTPTEVLAAHREGADGVKVFPASSGGPAHIRALHAVFPNIRLCPTGGVTAMNMSDYFGSGASLVGVGNDILDTGALARGDRAAVLMRAARYLKT